MELSECIRTRVDIRSYKPDPVPDDLIKEILDAAIQAPSSGNVQNWEFVIVRDAGTKEAISRAALGQDFIAAAPVVIVVCADLARIRPRYGERGVTLYSVQNTAAATQNLILAAWNKRLASCWVGAFSEAELKRILYLPADVRPLAIIALGWLAESPAKPSRRDLKEVIHFETFGKRM